MCIRHWVPFLATEAVSGGHAFILRTRGQAEGQKYKVILG